ncbi:MAG: hypothetical protein K9N48_00375 [Verrucomicrobia bacterium]|nr:hypothetical protein [Verrucomicrobiota bacterium]MCF7707519.1 hypothetical protein [Verrucomicrobiota bacterium]
MGTLAQDMLRLSEEIRGLHENRTELRVRLADDVEQIKENARFIVESANKGRAETREYLEKNREEFIRGLRRQVGRIQSEAKDMCHRFRDELVEAAESGRSERSAFIKGLDEKVKELTTQTRRLQQQIRDNHMQTAEQTRNELQGFMSELQSYVTDLCDGYRDAREEMGEAAAKERADFISNIAKSVEEICGEVASDLKSARSAFLGVVDTAVGRRTPTKKKTPERVKPKKEKAETLQDDLTVIKGIGAKTQERLNEDAGIYTYNQLATSNTAELCEKLSDMSVASEENVSKWIGYAKKLVKQ